MYSLKKLSLISLFSINILSFSASIDHIQNYTAEYGANPAQQGAVNIGSSVYFNPAGLTRLENGLYFVGGAQYAFGKQSMKFKNKNYDTNLSSPIPNFALYKVKDRNAYFFTFGALGGGAELHYKDSIPLPVGNFDMNSFLRHAEVKGSNMYAQTTLGKAYYLNDKWSASVAVRGVYAKRTLKANATTWEHLYNQAVIDSKREAFGYGVQFGLNYAPNEKLNIGFRYDSKVKLNFKTKSDILDNTGSNTALVSNTLLKLYPVYKDGAKLRRDLPAILALGASYKITDRWTSFVGGNYYFNESAKLDRISPNNIDYDNGWEISLGSEYWLNNKVSWLVGFNYANTGAPRNSYSATEYALSSKMIGTGFKYKPTSSTEVTFAYNHYFYDTNSNKNIKYKKEISSVGLNFVTKF